MLNTQRFITVLNNHADDFNTVIPIDTEFDKIAAIDLSKNNRAFTQDIYGSEEKFAAFIDAIRKESGTKYLIGGYKEHRQMYRRSTLFDTNVLDNMSPADEPRSLHLGIDIWGDVDTKVFAPFGGMIHSFAFNNNFGDYGATIILQHQLDTFNFYTLYGHLALKNLEGMRVGKYVTRGEPFANFGSYEENGNWPTHLHFQIVIDMGNYDGDYPGVCKISEAEKYVKNSPDPDLILKLLRYT
jgi:murein DD-endopeptidase MepM/ murein hydrolase activator NlpD